jgi:hypothetical protein
MKLSVLRLSYAPSGSNRNRRRRRSKRKKKVPDVTKAMNLKAQLTKRGFCGSIS